MHQRTSGFKYWAVNKHSLLKSQWNDSSTVWNTRKNGITRLKMLGNFWKMSGRRDCTDWTIRSQETEVQYGSREGLLNIKPRKTPKLRFSKNRNPGIPDWRSEYLKDGLLWAIWVLCHKYQWSVTMVPNLNQQEPLS